MKRNFRLLKNKFSVLGILNIKGVSDSYDKMIEESNKMADNLIPKLDNRLGNTNYNNTRDQKVKSKISLKISEKNLFGAN